MYNHVEGEILFKSMVAHTDMISVGCFSKFRFLNHQQTLPVNESYPHQKQFRCSLRIYVPFTVMTSCKGDGSNLCSYILDGEYLNYY